MTGKKKSETELQTDAKQQLEYRTVTCLEWKPVLEDDRMKDIIIDSMSFLCKHNWARIYAFVIMQNHLHMIWKILGEYELQNVQRNFLKFTGQQILKILRNENSPMYDEVVVNAKDRKRQVWERNSLGIPLWSKWIISQKLDYIHNNPVRAGLCEYGYEYEYSSARFYQFGDRRWEFLTRLEGL